MASSLSLILLSLLVFFLSVALFFVKPYSTSQTLSPIQGPNLDSKSSCSGKNHATNSSDSQGQAIQTLNPGEYSVAASFLKIQLFSVEEQGNHPCSSTLESCIRRNKATTEYPFGFRISMAWSQKSEELAGVVLPEARGIEIGIRSLAVELKRRVKEPFDFVDQQKFI
ncbi:hypothetical protein Fmac_016343 [Flemingia macrophylla]|uniref:Uncharacterized protein n=1 Tax=Flemingia macrophylla TaxID=520843 RepID=A0ABD1MH40_9FABA